MVDAGSGGSGGVTISVCLPARNEGETVGPIVREALGVDLVSEVIVVDDGSTDDTAAVAAAAGARVVTEASILPSAGPGAGKGNVLWKSIYECRGDVICWLDADLRNFKGACIARLCEPFRDDPTVALVKARYERWLDGAPTGGGRVTELVARPLLSLLFPKIADIAQPLGGEYAVRRSVVEQLPIVEGWGVEFAMLVDVVERCGREAVKEVEINAREHRNRPLEELTPQAQAVIATALARAGLATPGSGLPALRERPPMLTLDEYRARFSRS